MAMPLWPAFGTVAVGYRFAQVFRLNGPGFCQVCRGSGHPQYTIHAPRGQIQLFYRLVQQCSKLPIETAVYSQLLIVQQVILLAGARQLPAIGADDPVGVPARWSPAVHPAGFSRMSGEIFGTSMCTSIRSSNGPDTLPR